MALTLVLMTAGHAEEQVQLQDMVEGGTLGEVLGARQDGYGDVDEDPGDDDGDADAPAGDSDVAGDEATDEHSAALLQCQQQADTEEAKRLKFEMEAEECARKLQTAQTNIVGAQQKTTDEAALRANAVAETKRATDEEQRAVTLADQEKKTRENIASQCEAEVTSLQSANQAAILAAQQAASEEEARAATAASTISAEAEAERQKIVDDATLEREQAITDIQNERDNQLKLAEDSKNAAIATAEAQATQQETQMRADMALAVQTAQTNADSAIRKAQADRDEKIAAAQSERDTAVATLEGLQKEVFDKEALAATAEGQRQQAVSDASKYRAWAQAQLSDAKSKVQHAIQLAQTASMMQGTNLDDNTSPNSLDATVDAANAVAKSIEDQVAAAGAGPSL